MRASPRLLACLVALASAACGGGGDPDIDAPVGSDGAAPDGGSPDAPPMVTFEILDPPHGGTLRGIWGSSASDVWIGTEGTSLVVASSLLHWDGSAFTETSTPVADSIFGVSGTSPNDVWAVGTLSDGSHATILHHDGTGLSIAREENGAGTYRGVFARTPDDVWVVGDNMVLRYDGSTWSRPPSGPSTIDVDGYAVVGAGATDVWILGSYSGWRWDGTKLATAVHPPDLVAGMWAAGADDVWAVGLDGVYRYQGSDWTLVHQPPQGVAFRAIWGRSPDDVWAVGAEYNTAYAEHWDGATWTPVPIHDNGGPILASLTGVWGTADEVWMIGTAGTVLRGR